MKKTFEKWEIERGMFAKDLSLFNSSKEITLEEFNDITSNNLNVIVGVNYKDRVQFLRANGYEVNRENLMNSELSAKPVEE